MPGQQGSQPHTHGSFMYSGGSQAAGIHGISVPHHGNPQTMAESYPYLSPQMGNHSLRPQQYGAPEEGSTTMNQRYSIPAQSNHPLYPVSPSGTKRPYPSDFDPSVIGMADLDRSGFSGIQQTPLGAAYAHVAAVAVPQPQHQPIHHHHHLPDSEPPSKMMRRDDGLKGVPSVVGQVGMPNPAPQPRRPRLRFTPEEDQLLIELKKNKNLAWKQIAESFPGRSSGSVQVRYSTKLKAKSTKNK